MENFLRGTIPTGEQDSSRDNAAPIKLRVQSEAPAARAPSLPAGDRPAPAMGARTCDGSLCFPLPAACTALGLRAPQRGDAPPAWPPCLSFPDFGNDIHGSSPAQQAEQQQLNGGGWSPLKIFHLFYVVTGFIFNVPAAKNDMPELSREDVFAGPCQDDEFLAGNPLEKRRCGVSCRARSQVKGWALFQIAPQPR